MPIVWGSADAVAVTKAEVETAALQHSKGIVSRAGHVILGPALPISVGGGVDQQQQPL